MKHGNHSSHIVPLLGGRQTCAPTDFFVQNLILNNFHSKHFFNIPNRYSVISAAFSSKMNVLPHFLLGNNFLKSILEKSISPSTMRSEQFALGTSHPIPFMIAQNTWQVSVRSEWYVNCWQTVQRMFAVSSTHTHIWFFP